jgi:hypothetical protein
MSNINEKENNNGSINNTSIDSNGNGDLAATDTTTVNGNGSLDATDTTTVQPSTQTVRFERMSNGKCDLTFTPTSTTSTTNNTSKAATDTTDTTTTQPNSVSIPNVSFPYEFDPLDHGFNSVNGTYTFDCCGCPYVFVIDGEDNSVTTTTTEEVTTTTTSKDTDPITTTTTTEEVTTTTTTEDVCDNCTTVRVRKNPLSTNVSFDYIDCDNNSQSYTFQTKVAVIDLCVCTGSIPSSDDYTVEFIEECTTGLPVLTCDLLQFTVNDGENGELVSFNNGSGLFIPAQVTPIQYNLGVGTYTVSVTVPDGYSNAGDTLECVSDEVIVSQGGGDTTTTSTKGSSNAFCAKVTYGPNSPNTLQTPQGGEILEFQINQMFTYSNEDGGGFFRICTDNGAFYVVENNSVRVIQESDDIDIEYNTDDRCTTDGSGNIDCVQRV